MKLIAASALAMALCPALAGAHDWHHHDHRRECLDDN